MDNKENESKETIHQPVLYRYIVDDYDSSETGNFPNYHLTLKEFPVIRETPACYVIREYRHWGKEKFVLKAKGIKRFAYTTKERALDNYIARTEFYKRHLKRQLSSATQGLKLALQLRDNQYA